MIATLLIIALYLFALAFFAFVLLIYPIAFYTLFIFLILYLVAYGISSYLKYRSQQKALRKAVQDYVAKKRAEISTYSQGSHS
ncbi:hypothetical protein [Pampinifervens florentissimum]|uniref:hypothetical protein n=1 Tax=Pampinifervens florentissimum TaxID=1632019 RepID=UPI0013B49EFE|nr:hypothetical protein [Hydrogenobacter sp. T-8]QID32388.1 hypothetical protein G3M65_00755 [Hydrogenobacter sp. T-8]